MSGTHVGSVRDVGAMDALFWELRRSCALGRVLEIGCGTGELVRRLVEHGVNAFGVERDPNAVREAGRRTPGRCRLMGEAGLPFADGEFDTVLCVNGLSRAPEDEVERLIGEIRRVATRHVYLRLESNRFRTREWWDARFLRAGFRRHPALLRMVDYGSLEDESRGVVLLLERIPESALACYPLARLAAERDLHMDMLREAGRRSDAHLQRYAVAAGLV